MRDAPPVPAVGASPVVGERGAFCQPICRWRTPSKRRVEDAIWTKKHQKNSQKIRKKWKTAARVKSGKPPAMRVRGVLRMQYTQLKNCNTKCKPPPPKHAYTDCNTSTPAKIRQPSQMPVPVGTAHLFFLSAMGIAAAEREGFEPSVTSLPRSISSRVP